MEQKQQNLAQPTETDQKNEQPNKDFQQVGLMHSQNMEWTQTPSNTVFRKRLECKGAKEAGRVTSVVKYEENSKFPQHPHPGGEEIFVLDGIFSDQTGDHKEGSLLLNPEGFSHAPFSVGGCTLFVKLKQYNPGQRTTERQNINNLEFETDSNKTLYKIPNVQEKVLYNKTQEQNENERFQDTITYEKWNKNSKFENLQYKDGAEYFVISGSINYENNGLLSKGSWLRIPPNQSHWLQTNEEDCVMYIKRNHLYNEQAQQQ